MDVLQLLHSDVTLVQYQQEVTIILEDYKQNVE